MLLTAQLRNELFRHVTEKNSTDSAGGVQIVCDAKRIPPSTTLKNTLTRREARHWVGRRWVTPEIIGRSRPALSSYIHFAPQRVRLQPAHVNCKTLSWPTGFAARLTNKGAIWEMHARKKVLQMEWLRAIAGDMRCGSLCRWSDLGIGICAGHPIMVGCLTKFRRGFGLFLRF